MSNIRQGAFWMIAAGFSFTAMLVCVRYLEGRYPSVEVVFFRAFVGLVFVLPPLLRTGIRGLHTNHFPLHISRASFSLLAMVVYYYAVPFIPLADSTTYSFIIPLFVTLGAVLFLKEKVDGPRWAATLVGFMGVIIVLRPGQGGLSFPVLMMMLSVLFYAGAWISMKFLTRTDEAAVIVFYQNILIVPLALIPTLFIGLVPTLEDLFILIGVGLFGSYAHFCQAKSFGSADASAVMPFDFLRLPFSVICAWFLFEEPTDIWTWLGAMIIFGSTYYITWWETRVRKRDSS
ncbi:MAG: DMT family transporter [Rhodospirillaceae bacterium]|jgi:drug/metabolite transporter (DMT)-like permease|nr:DMT family transporter [Rhodospirillaceae bacterium]MBT5455779.1 DMT family transporter [Rhodospirillaceae bacterium]